MTGLKRGTVHLSAHDPAWADQARETIRILWEVFGDLAKDIQHIGSTAIPGIEAKPIIDIAVGVGSFEGLRVFRSGTTVFPATFSMCWRRRTGCAPTRCIFSSLTVCNGTTTWISGIT